MMFQKSLLANFIKNYHVEIKNSLKCILNCKTEKKNFFLNWMKFHDVQKVPDEPTLFGPTFDTSLILTKTTSWPNLNKIIQDAHKLSWLQQKI